MRTFSLRILKASWGLAIDLQAQSQVRHEAWREDAQAASRIWLRVSCNLPPEDKDQLLRGLRMVSPALERSSPNQHVLVEVVNVSYNPTDYQPEGLALAMVGWASEEFGLDPPEPKVEFNREGNRYEIEWQ